MAPRVRACAPGCQGRHSYTADARRVCWRPAGATPLRAAVDAERAEQRVPDRLAARHGASDFWGRWTRAEALAKVTDTPIALWLRAHGLDADAPAGVIVETRRLDDLVVSTAVVP